ncbi:MAG TPA: hypothetical protein VN026_17730 [Bacteroidia bacterium]|nr:hypothetical protein [Bacteroidia bacterium]
MKKMILCASMFVLFQTLSAATVIVNNGTGYTIQVTYFFGSKNESKTVSIADLKSEKIDSGIHGFNRLQWDQENGKKFSISMPSDRFMLDGRIVLGWEGDYRINFNKQGKYTVDGKEEKSGKAQPVQVPAPAMNNPQLAQANLEKQKELFMKIVNSDDAQVERWPVNLPANAWQLSNSPQSCKNAWDALDIVMKRVAWSDNPNQVLAALKMLWPFLEKFKIMNVYEVKLVYGASHPGMPQNIKSEAIKVIGSAKDKVKNLGSSVK